MVSLIHDRVQGRNTTTSDPILHIVASSPVAASRKDRESWLDLFDEDASIEDPAGSLPYRSNDPGHGLKDFYDAFIAHSNIAFASEYDYVCDRSVVRDGTILLEIGDGQPLHIPVFLRYEVAKSGKISNMQAYWRLGQSIFRMLGNRSGGFRYLTGAGKRLFAAAGLRGIGGLAKATVNPAAGARTTVLKLKEYLDTARYSDAVSLFSYTNSNAIVLYSDNAEAHPAGYLTIGKLKLLSLDKIIESRNRVSFRCELLISGRKLCGVAFCRLSAAGFRIRTLEFFFSRYPAKD